MYTDLILYINELKNKTLPKYKLIGIVTELILSKEIFKRNQEITEFIKYIFDINFKEYIMKSRTMIVAKISKNIYDCADYSDYKNKLFEFINKQIEILKRNEKVKDEKNEFKGWVSI